MAQTLYRLGGFLASRMFLGGRLLSSDGFDT